MTVKTAVSLEVLWTVLQAAPVAAHVLSPLPPRLPELRERHQALASRLSTIGRPVRYLGTMPLFAGHRVYHAPQRDWVLVNAADDPLLRDRDGFPAPRRVLDNLRGLTRFGVEFDCVYVAHEVPRGAVRNDRPLSAEALTPGASSATRRLARQLGAIGETLGKFATLTSDEGLAWMLATSTLGAALPALLDPIILGTLTDGMRWPRAGAPAAWYYLDHWSYGQEG